MTTLPNTAMAGNGGPALGQWQLPTLKRSCTNRLRLRSLHKPFAACGPLAGSGALTASSASHVRRGRAAGVRVYQVAREHVLWLRVQQPRLALQVPAQTAPGLSYALHCMTRHMPRAAAPARQARGRDTAQAHVRSISVTWSSSAFHSGVVEICVPESSISCICCAPHRQRLLSGRAGCMLHQARVTQRPE